MNEELTSSRYTLALTAATNKIAKVERSILTAKRNEYIFESRYKYQKRERERIKENVLKNYIF